MLIVNTIIDERNSTSKQRVFSIATIGYGQEQLIFHHTPYTYSIVSHVLNFLIVDFMLCEYKTCLNIGYFQKHEKNCVQKPSSHFRFYFCCSFLAIHLQLTYYEFIATKFKAFSTSIFVFEYSVYIVC